MQCSASPTPTSSSVWCPARTLLPRFSVFPKVAAVPHPLCAPGLTAALWGSCGAHEQAWERSRVQPTYSLSHLNSFYGRVSTRIMKMRFKSKRRQIFDEYQGKTAGREEVKKKVWIERLSCAALPGAAGSVTEVADGLCPACCGQRHHSPHSCWPAVSEWVTACYSRCHTAQLHGFQAFVVYLGCSDYNLTASRARCAKYTSAGLGWWDLGRGGLALGCGGREATLLPACPGCRDLGAASWLVMCSSTSQQSRKHGHLTLIPAGTSPASLCDGDAVG